MAMDGVNNHGGLGGGTIKTLLENLTPAGKDASSRRAAADRAIISGSMTRVTVSAFGKQINEMHAELKTIEDPQAREQALAGMQQVMMGMAGGSDPSRMVNFMQTMGELQESDSATFREFFQTADQLSAGGFNMDRWLDTFVSIGDRGLQGAFLAETRSIINDPEAGAVEKRTTFNQFLGAVNSIMSGDGEDGSINAAMSRFVEGMAGAADLASKNDFMKTYSEERADPTSGATGEDG